MFDIVGEGDFFQGNDKDLLKRVSPVFNTDDIADTEIKIKTGTGHVENISKLTQINQKAFVNKRLTIFNGTGPIETAVNLWDKKVQLEDVTNGMQFHPETNEGTIRIYDNQFQRHLQFQYHKDENLKGTDDSNTLVKTFREDTISNSDMILKSSPNGTMHLGPAFNLQVVMAKQGCINCEDTLTQKVTVNGEVYSKQVP